MNRYNRIIFWYWLVGCLCVSSVSAAEPELFECLMEPTVVTEIGSPVQGVIKQLLVDRSDFVTRGQPIIELEADAETTNLAAATARADMQSEVSACEADVVLAKLDLARIQTLHEKNLVPAQKLDGAHAQRQVAGAALVQAPENRKLTHIEAEGAAQLLAQKTIHRPIDGVVVTQHTFPGELVYDNPLLTLAQPDWLRIEAVLPVWPFGGFQPGDTALIRPKIEHADPLQTNLLIWYEIRGRQAAAYCT